MASKELLLQELDVFIEQTECRLNAILSKLEWSKEYLIRSQLEIKNKTAEEGGKRIRNPDETFPPSFHPTDAPFSIRMDNIQQAEAILEGVYQNPSFELGVPLEEICTREPPSNIEELHVNFTREERLLLYEHAVKNTLPPPNVPDIKIRFKQDSHSEEKRASWPEIAAMERDARRRNPKYRVARNPLTYNEEVRHLIHIQTEALAQHLRHETALQQHADSMVSHKKSKRRRRSRSGSITAERRHRKKKRTRSRSRSKKRSQKRTTSPERKHHKSHKKHKKKHDR